MNIQKARIEKKIFFFAKQIYYGNEGACACSCSGQFRAILKVE